MISSTSQSFAKAAYSHAKSNHVTKAWQQMLTQLVTVTKQKKIQAFLSSPALIEDKLKILSELVELLPKQRVWLRQVLQAKKGHMIEQMLKAFTNLYEADENIHTLIITSANHLSQSAQKRIEEKARQQLQQQLNIQFCTDPNLIGGIILSYNDRVIDLSFNRILEQLTIN
ncbi:ATP synthase F1 subunit delta [Gammaproteobacteria bacterium]|nr:ATP synthase F1 subunit delta [Gammaproteobacteria bacterium]